MEKSTLEMLEILLRIKEAKKAHLESYEYSHIISVLIDINDAEISCIENMIRENELSNLDENKSKPYQAFFDGSSRGNPGPSKIGYLIMDSNGSIVASKAISVGDGTNNEAEYLALIELLGTLCELKINDVIIQGDSKLVVNQVAGDWKVKNERLKILNQKAKLLLYDIPSWKLEWIPRKNNYLANKLAQS